MREIEDDLEVEQKSEEVAASTFTALSSRGWTWGGLHLTVPRALPCCIWWTQTMEISSRSPLIENTVTWRLHTVSFLSCFFIARRSESWVGYEGDAFESGLKHRQETLRFVWNPFNIFDFVWEVFEKCLRSVWDAFVEWDQNNFPINKCAKWKTR